MLVWATGSLSEPSIPAFPGLDGFRGKVFHSARWEHGYDLSGKRVCVVGTGASAVQFVPQIAPVVEHLYLHQRTPPWIVPRRDRPVSRLRRLVYRKVPVTQRLSRLRIYSLFEVLLSVFVGQGTRRKAAVRKAALDHLARQVPDETLRAKLTPDYEPGCKRLLLSDDYYPALGRPNVEVVESPVASFTAHEVVGQDGIARPVDVVIMGTGFDAAEPPYAQHIVGRDGARLSEVWKADGVEAYAGSTVAGFPNLFLMIGPNVTLAHNSMIYMIESHINYIASALAFMSRPGVHVVEVRRSVQRRYNERLQAKLEHSVWVDGGCGSWYLDHRGRNTTLWPDHTWKFRRLTRRFHPGEYTVRAVGAERERHEHRGEQREDPDLRQHRDESGVVVDQVHEGIHGPGLGHHVADGTHDRSDDVEGVHAAAQHPAHDAEDDGQRDRLLLGARAHAHQRGRARVGQRQHREHEEDAGGIAPVHAEDQPAHHEEPRRLDGGDAQARRHQRGHDAPPPHRCRREPPHDAQTARFHHAGGEEEHRDAQEQDEVGRCDVGEGAERRRHVGVGERLVGHRRVHPFGGHEVEQRHHVGAGLDRARRCRLADEVDPDGAGWRRQPDQPGDDPAAEMSSPSCARSGSSRTLRSPVCATSWSRRGEGCTRPTGSLGLPARIPVTRMNRTGKTVATRR